MYKKKHMDTPCADAPQTPNIREIFPISHADILKSYRCTGKPTNEWECKTYWEAPPYRGRCKGGVQHVRDPLQPPQHEEASGYIQMHRGVWDIWGCLHP